MAISNFAIKYTDENYFTKADLSAALHMSSIDSFWRDILAYRSQYQRKIGLKNIHQVPFYGVFTPSINAKLNEFIGKVSDLDSKIQNLNVDVKKQLEKEHLINSIRYVTILEDKKIGELSLRSMVNGTYRESNVDHTSILHYLSALREFYSNSSLILNEDFLIKYYSILLGDDNFESLFRVRNIDNTYKFNTTIIGKDYDYAQANLIPELMIEFYDFVSTGGGDPFAKAIMALYYFDYIKPFSAYNKEMGILVAKSIISSYGYDKAAPYIPFEAIFKDFEQYSKYALETKKTGDLTYVIFYSLNVISSCLDEIFSSSERIETETISNEQFQELKVSLKEAQSKSKKDDGQMSLFDFNQIEDKPTETQPVVEKKIEPKHIVEPTKSIDIKPQIQVSALSDSLVKKSNIDVKEFEKYILETNPSIKKQQAKFFATHCELGHYYSIQDYKAASKVVYETARTSMDNLAAEGFYKKIKLKNKFVYTPIKQEGK